MFSAAKISLILTFGANSDLFAALVSFCVSVVRGFVVRPLFSLFQATYRFKSVQVACAKLKPNAGNSAKIRLIFYAYNTVARGVRRGNNACEQI